MLNFALIALAALQSSVSPEPQPMDRAELTRLLAEYEQRAPQVAGSPKLVMVQPSLGFFMGGGAQYTYQVAASRVDDQLCSVDLVTYGLRRPYLPPPPPPGSKPLQRSEEGTRPEYMPLLNQQRYVPHEGMIPYARNGAASTRSPCEGWVDYERSFGSDDAATAQVAYVLIERLREITDSTQVVTCTGVERHCARIGELMTRSRIDGARRCQPASSSGRCIQFEISHYGSLFDGGQRLRVSTSTSFADGALEIAISDLPPPPLA